MRPFRPQALRSLRPARNTVTPPVSPFIHGQSIRSFSQAAARRNQHDDQPHEHSDPVIVRKKQFTFKRVTYSIFTTLVIYGGTTWILSKFAQALDIDEEELEKHRQEEHSDEDGSLFIPLTIPQMLPQEFYKQSDPDWQAFVKMSNDEGKANTVREELANRCLKDVSSNPKLQHVLGSNISLGQYWLDLKYPDKPPPEYTRYGLEVNDEFIALSSQTIPHTHYVQLRHLMYPEAIFLATYNSVLIFSQLQMIKVKAAFGLDMTQRDKQIAAISQMEKGRLAMEAMQQQLDAQKDAASTEKQRTTDQLRNPNSTSDNNSSTPHQPSLPTTQTDPPSSSPVSHPLLSMVLPTSSSSDPNSQDSQNSALSYLRPSTDMTLAWKMFLSTLQQTWRKSRRDAQPKGAFYIVGQIELRGERGRIRCDVQAAYDPKIAKIVYCVTSVKHFWEWRQRAKGGP